MLNDFDSFVVYLDPDTLKYMFLNYMKSRNYPVMKKLYSVLNEGYENNMIVTPISYNQIISYIEENTIDNEYLAMMGNIGQIQFNKRFTIRTLQLIRIINHFFEQKYKKPIWMDAFSSNPDNKYMPGFNQYRSISVQNVLKAFEREEKYSRVYSFIESYKEGKSFEDIAGEYFRYSWEQFPDIIKPFLPIDGTPEYNMKRFLEYEEIKEIPEYHIISNILHPLFEKHGIKDIESGLKDDLLLAAETAAVYMPYCHFYVTTVDIAEIIMMTGINEPYNVMVYDHNESSLYKLIDDISILIKTKKIESKRKTSKTIFRKNRY